MISTRRLLAFTFFSIVAYGCSTNNSVEEHGSGSHEGRAEHAREGGEHGREEGEESGTELALTETYDAVRNGARLILRYNAQEASFQGTVQNTTNEPLERVRVEVHLSNGMELGPTPAADLAPGATREVKLTTSGKGFERWTAHAEVGNEEHAHGEHGGEGHGRGEHGEHSGGEHGREGRGEHGGE